MLKKNYLTVLNRIEDIAKHSKKFDYDCVLDGTYNFNVNEVSVAYDLLHIVEVISSANDSLVCINQGDTLLKELRFCFNGIIYKVTRLYGADESTVITKAPFEGGGYFVPEEDLMNHIELKCLANRKILSSFYGGITDEDPAG